MNTRQTNKQTNKQTITSLSVIIPVYNVEKYLRHCLDSLTEIIPDNIEFIVIDDGSTDSSSDIVDEYAQKYSCIKVVHQENKGLCAARNLGLQLAQGKYIAFVDSDDFVKPEMFSKMLEKAIETDADIVSCSFCRYFEKDGVFVPGDNSSQIKCLEKTGGYISGAEELFLEEAFIWNRLYKREIIERHSINFDIDVAFAEDTYFHRRALLHSKTMAMIPDCFYMYRLGRVGQNTARRDERIFGFFDICERLFSDIILLDSENFVPWFKHFVLSFLCYGYESVDSHLKESYFEKFCLFLIDHDILQKSKIAYPKQNGGLFFQARYFILRILHPLTLHALLQKDIDLFNKIIYWRKAFESLAEKIRLKIR